MLLLTEPINYTLVQPWVRISSRTRSATGSPNTAASTTPCAGRWGAGNAPVHPAAAGLVGTDHLRRHGADVHPLPNVCGRGHRRGQPLRQGAEQQKAEWRHQHGYDKPLLVNVHRQLVIDDNTTGPNPFMVSDPPDSGSEAANALALVLENPPQSDQPAPPPAAKDDPPASEPASTPTTVPTTAPATAPATAPTTTTAPTDTQPAGELNTAQKFAAATSTACRPTRRSKNSRLRYRWSVRFRERRRQPRPRPHPQPPPHPPRRPHPHKRLRFPGPFSRCNCPTAPPWTLTSPAFARPAN